MNKNWKSLGTFALALLAPFVAAAIGNVATQPAIGTWYQALRKPDWNPPRWLFGPVWSALYLMMGMASWLVWRKRETTFPWLGIRNEKQQHKVEGALRLYGVHLIFNALWSVLFFGLHRLDWAFAEVVVLWSLILTTLTRFYRIDARAGWLLVPYQAWVTFASILNFTVWRMNRDKVESTVVDLQG
ncbi:MAG: TspO/MBR family protein [Caldilineaceae bacterium]